MVPRSAHRPANLHSQLNAVQKRKTQYKEEVKKGRSKIEGLRDEETVLDWIKRTGRLQGKGKAAFKALAAFSEGETTATTKGSDGDGLKKAKKAENTPSIQSIRTMTKSSNPFDLLMGL